MALNPDGLCQQPIILFVVVKVMRLVTPRGFAQSLHHRLGPTHLACDFTSFFSAEARVNTKPFEQVQILQSSIWINAARPFRISKQTKASFPNSLLRSFTFHR